MKFYSRQGQICSVSHSKMLRNSADLLIQFAIINKIEKIIYTSMIRIS